MYANTPLLTCRFGALEETAGPHSYLIDYSIVPNGLFPTINPTLQADKFVDMVVEAANNPEEHRRRMLALDEIKDLVGWEVTALEWKQHIYSKLGLYLSRGENRRARYTKSKYHKVFGRRYTTPEEWLAPKQTEKKIVVVSPVYNAEKYIEQCIASVAAQDYDNYEHWIVDDASTDSTAVVAETYISNLPADIQSKFKVIRNTDNQGAGYNYVQAIREQTPDTIVMMLDGDDSLANRPDVFDHYNKIHDDYDFTYGSCWSVVDNIPLQAQPYPPEVKAAKTYKDYKFNWNIPYTHLRTLKAKSIIGTSDSSFQDSDGRWFKAGNDLAIFYTAINNVDPSRVYAVSDILHNYNDASPLNDYKVNRSEQDRTIAAVVGESAVPKTSIKQFKKEIPPRPEKTVMNTPPATKKILIAVPTNRNIEAQTFKSIYELMTPPGCEVVFQYFWGYQVDQVRNLIAHWAIQNGFDYVFAVDSDIAFAPDTLVRLMAHNVDIVSGVYIQRIPGTHTIEIMRKNEWGGVTHVNWGDIKGQGLVPIDGCGFGCTLVKIEVFKGIPYPQFLYHSAIEHANTVSEDVHFCNQARDRGFKLWCDTDIICDHIGSWTFKVDMNIPNTIPKKKNRLRELSGMRLMPPGHQQYLYTMRDEQHITPTVIYDIGACVLHWTTIAKEVWADSAYYMFEAMEDSEILYKERGLPYHIGLLSSEDGKEIAFYENTEHPGGNSYYRENVEYSPDAKDLFDDTHKVMKRSFTLDTAVRLNGFPPPDLIKMDIQGAEMDVLKGAQESLKTCKDLILELQHVEYNTGAPLKDEVIAYVESLGFTLVTPLFASAMGVDGDYHFTRR
jgi:FkbM family methyltransferase